MIWWFCRCHIVALVFPVLESVRSVGVDKLVQMDALEPAKKFFPFGMVGQNGVCAEANRGLYTTRDEVLFVPEWGPLKGTRVRGFDRGSHVVEKICRWFLHRQVAAHITKSAYFAMTAYSFVQEVLNATRDLGGRGNALREEGGYVGK